MTRLVYEHGYAGLTVQQIVAEAHVSRPTFYRLFQGKEDCFYAAYTEAAAEAIKWTAAATEGCVDREDLITSGARAFCSAVAFNPAGASLVLLEPMSVGAPARERMRKVESMFAELLQKRYGELRDPIAIPPIFARGMIAGVGRVARWRLNSGEPDRFGEDIEEIVRWSARVSDIGSFERWRSKAPGAEQVRRPEQSAIPVLTSSEDRSFLVNATIRLVAERGYDGLTVADIAATAGVPRRRFEAEFASLDDCFSAAIEVGAAASVNAARAAYDAGEPGVPAIGRAVDAFTGYLAANPAIARVLFVEIFRPGRSVTKPSAQILSALASLLVERMPAGTGPSAPSAEASVGAVWSLIRHEVAQGRTRRLPQTAPVLNWFVLAPSVQLD